MRSTVTLPPANLMVRAAAASAAVRSGAGDSAARGCVAVRTKATTNVDVRSMLVWLTTDWVDFRTKRHDGKI
jgi:hypothetical protein